MTEGDHQQGSTPQHEATEFILYPRRWIILLAFTMLTVSNSWVWTSWSPIASEVATFWSVPLSSVDALASIYFYTFLPLVFLAMYLIVDVLGLAKGLWLAAGLNAAGVTLRWVGRSSYWCVYAGTCLCAYTNVSVMPMPPMLAGRWFGLHERTTATAIGVLANKLGGGAGLGSTILVNFLRRNGQLNEAVLGRYLFVQSFVAVTGFLLLLIFMKDDEPATPPSLSEALRRDRPKEQSLDPSMATEETKLFPTQNSTSTEDPEETAGKENKDTENDDKIAAALNDMGDGSFQTSLRLGLKYGWKFSIVYGLVIGTFYTIPPFVAQFVPNWPPSQSGWLGFLFQTTGVFGSYITGLMADKYQNHNTLLRILIVLSGVFVACFGVVQTSNQHWLVFMMVMAAGYCLASSSTLGFDIAAGMAYPANEATVGSLLQCAAQSYSFVGVTIGGWLTANTSFVIFLCSNVAVASVIVFSMSIESRRPVE